MKTVLIGSFPTCFPLIDYLKNQLNLIGVCTEQKEILDSKNNAIELFNDIELLYINKSILNNELNVWLTSKQPDLVLVCGCSLKIPSQLLTIPTFGFLNIHFGSLPENKGPNPIFWSIKNGEAKTKISIHRISNEWDSGDILMEKSFDMIAGETSGILNSKLSYGAVHMISECLALIPDKNNFKPQFENEISKYNKRPTEQERTINWKNQDAEEIENLVNACNPVYGGAITYYQSTAVRILEVSPVKTQIHYNGKNAGEIIHASPQDGLFVICRDNQILRINILSSDAGILSGNKYAGLGVIAGQRFTTFLEEKIELQLK